MSETKRLSEEDAKTIRDLLGEDAVAVIALNRSGDARGVPLYPPKESMDTDVNLKDYKNVDLGCLLVRATPSNPRCCLIWYGPRGLECLWYC
jgi:hypothetical protein